MSIGCLEGVWKVSGRCLESTRKVSGGCLKGVWKVSTRCLGTGLVRIGQVKLGQVKSGQVKYLSTVRCLNELSEVSSRCLTVVWMVSKSFL